MSEKYTVMFNDKASYDKYKKEVTATGGTIVHDLGGLLGFTAVIPPVLLQMMKSENLAGDDGIASLEADSVVTIQHQ